MATVLIKNALGEFKYIEVDGAGTEGDPYRLKGTHADDVLAALEAIQAATEAGGGVPTGAATSALQTTGNATLSAIDGHVDGLETSAASIDGKTPALGQAVAGASVPVVLPATQITTLTPPAAITGFATAAKQPALGVAGTASTDVITVQGIASGVAQPVSDGGGSLTVDGTFWQATQPVSGTLTAVTTVGTVTNVVHVDDNAGSITVDGTVAVSALPAGTNNIGDVDVLTLPALPVGNNNIGDVDIASIAAGDNNIGNVDIVTMPNVTVGAALPAGTNNIGDVDVLTMPDVRESWRVSTLSFTAADDSDNTFVVPANTEYQILSVYVSLVTTATAGNRQMAVQALDASDNILIGARAGIVQTASLTRVYNFAPGMPQDTAFRDTDYLAISLPSIFLAPGQKLRVWDKAAIAAAADDMVVRVQIASRSIA